MKRSAVDDRERAIETLRQRQRGSAAAELSAHPPSRSRFHFLDDVAIEKLPPLVYQVADHVPAGGLTVIFAPPESAKTFFALMLAFCVATGTDFFGHAVRRGAVVYVSAEGSSGLPARVGALKHSLELYGERAGVFFVTEPVQLLDDESVNTFVAALDTLGLPVSLIIYDTLHRCMVGGDENSARDMGVVIQALDRIRVATGAAQLPVHHTRKDGDAERGSTSLRGAADSMISLKREGEQLTVTCEKQKDAPHFTPYTLELVETLDSCVLVTAKNRVSVSNLMPGDPRHIALTILHESSTGEGLSTTAWLKASGMPERKFFRCRKFLVTSGYVDAAPKKGAPNFITPRGVAAVTDILTLTDNRTDSQQAVHTACQPLSLREAT